MTFELKAIKKIQHYGYRRAEPLGVFLTLEGKEAEQLVRMLASLAGTDHDNHTLYVVDDTVILYWSDHKLYIGTGYRSTW